MIKNTLIIFSLLISFVVYAQEPAKIKPAQSMGTPRAYHEGIFIPIEGSYLVCGGKNGNTTLKSCEFFSLTNMSWSNGPTMKVERKNPPLANIFALSKQGSEKGSILIAGGVDSSGNSMIKVDFYDIQTKSVDDFKQLPVPHSGGISFFNPTEEPLILAVMIGPGINITKLLIANNDINWVQSPNSLHYPRDGHKFVAIPDYRILIVGGGSEKMEIYNYKDDTISEAKDTIIDITGHQIINMSDSRILIAGGVDKNGVINQNTYIYDPINDSLSTTSQMNIPRKDFRLTLLHNGKVLASGGIDKDGNAISKLEIFDPASGRWSETLSLNFPRANHTAELIGAEGVLICGGNTGENTASIKNCEIYSPEKICTPGSFSCDGNWIVKCNSFGDGTNKTNECAGGCKDGQCIGGCTEGERRCRDIGVKIIVEICNATGGWVLLERCEESCKNGYCDGQIPPRDAGVNDSGRDTLISDYYIEDHQTADEVLVEDIIINSDNGIIPDAAISDSFNNSNPSEGCSCNLIE